MLAGSTNRGVGASLHAAPSQEASKESHDSDGEALEIVFDKEGDEAQEQTRELQAQVQGEGEGHDLRREGGEKEMRTCGRS